MAAAQGFFPVQQPFLCLLDVICAVFPSLPVSRAVAQTQASREQKSTQTPDPLHDEYKLYLTLDLVKRLVAKRMPEFLTSDVLAQLTKAGILSSSTVKTLTLSTGHSKNVRLRSINRSFVNGYGRRDITTIST